MKIILLKDVSKIGQKNTVKNVSDGYAMNFLFPNNLAEPATPNKIKNLEKIKLNQETENQINQDLLTKNMRSLNSATIEMEGKANDQGHLFKGIHVEEIVAELKKQDHIDLMPEHIELKHPIKETGEFNITAKVGDTKAVFKLVVSAI